jgi:hypothetical protein
MSYYQQSRTDLASHLAEQLEFLQASADAFDRGRDGEAKRLAVSVRVLVHETKNSRSLLGQLGLLSQNFVSTVFPDVVGNLTAHGGLISMAVSGPETSYIAMLDDVPMVRQLSFRDWWDETVFTDDTKTTLSRRELVLSVADQDGGAHVDPTLNEAYAKLSRENSMGWVVAAAGETKPIPKPERAAIRQIAHEVLRTLIPGYTKRISREADVFFGGAMIFNEVPSAFSLQEHIKAGRNDRCPCGSGKKYKICHGRPSH